MSVYSQVNIWESDDEFRLKKIREHSPNTVIDLGCGNGRMTFPISNFVSNIIAIDPDATAINEARELDIENRIKWVIGDSQSITDTEVDAIMMLTNVSQEIVDESNWKQTLKDCYKALKKEGVLIFDGRNFYQKGWIHWTKEKTLQKIIIDNNVEAEFWHEVYEVDDNFVKFYTYIVSENSKEVYDSSMVFRTKDETVKLLKSIGFDKVKVYGDWQEINATNNHKEFLFIAQR